MAIDDFETPKQAAKLDSMLEACFDLNPLGLEKSIFQHVVDNSNLHLDGINLKEPKIDKDQIEPNSQNIPSIMVESNFP